MSSCFDSKHVTTWSHHLLLSRSAPRGVFSFSLVELPLNRPPASHRPNTPPQEPELTYCWMIQPVCWRTGVVPDPAGEFLSCPSLEWHCGTPHVRTRMVWEPLWRFLDLREGSSWSPCLSELAFDSGLLGNCVSAGRDEED